MTSEKSFQAYFMKSVPHGYRTALISGSGFPDCLLIHGDRHSLVELKILPIGPSGDKKLKGLFKPTQPPWYIDYLHSGGKRLYVVFKLESTYGILHVDKSFVLNIDKVKYSDLKDYFLHRVPDTQGADS
jgi:hypothetical protein